MKRVFNKKAFSLKRKSNYSEQVHKNKCKEKKNDTWWPYWAGSMLKKIRL
jgi:hypothetical protein